MSAPERIQVQLSNFEKLQILRDQFDERKAELGRVEVEIRDQLTLMETQRYLETIGPYYAANPVANLPTREAVEALEARRQQLTELIANIEALIPILLTQKGDAGSQAQSGGTAAPAGPARKVKFDSFEDFQKTKG